MAPAENNKHQSKAVMVWLFVSAFMVFAMMVIGAITRLTESGLSMVEWRPLIGALPPLNEAEWQRVFSLYQQTPEYIKINFWMGLEDFKTIFFWEWFHRFWGRMIGVVFAAPLLWFWIKKSIPQGYHLKLLGMLILGGLQGVMGWYMVESGLVDNPMVSQYRLAAHLMLAMLIMALLVYLAIKIGGIKQNPNQALYRHSLVTLVFVSITIFWGALTAGLDAGLIYNETFPKMGETWLPHDAFHLQPAWLNAFENHATVQFMHRWIATATTLVTLSLWLHGVMKAHTFAALHALGILVLLQFSLGIITLLSQVQIHAAASHQAGAALLLAALVVCIYKLKPTDPDPSLSASKA